MADNSRHARRRPASRTGRLPVAGSLRRFPGGPAGDRRWADRCRRAGVAAAGAGRAGAGADAGGAGNGAGRHRVHLDVVDAGALVARRDPLAAGGVADAGADRRRPVRRGAGDAVAEPAAGDFRGGVLPAQCGAAGLGRQPSDHRPRRCGGSRPAGGGRAGYRCGVGGGRYRRRFDDGAVAGVAGCATGAGGGDIGRLRGGDRAGVGQRLHRIAARAGGGLAAGQLGLCVRAGGAGHRRRQRVDGTVGCATGAPPVGATAAPGVRAVPVADRAADGARRHAPSAAAQPGRSWIRVCWRSASRRWRSA